MTSPKPFTAEELDELEQELELCTYVRLRAEYLPEDSGKLSRLIAQAREAIRLRESQCAYVECWGNYGPYGGASNEPCGWSGPRPADNVCPTCHAGYLRPTDDPAARAKRELGEFLVSNSGWTQWREDRGEEYEDERWVCQLTHATGHGHKKFRPTEHEAISAALRAAKETP